MSSLVSYIKAIFKRAIGSVLISNFLGWYRAQVHDGIDVYNHITSTSLYENGNNTINAKLPVYINTWRLWQNGKFPNRTLYLQNVLTGHWYHSYNVSCSLLYQKVHESKLMSHYVTHTLQSLISFPVSDGRHLTSIGWLAKNCVAKYSRRRCGVHRPVPKPDQ